MSHLSPVSALCGSITAERHRNPLNYLIVLQPDSVETLSLSGSLSEAAMNFSSFHYGRPRFGRFWNGDDEKLEHKMRLHATSCSLTPHCGFPHPFCSCTRLGVTNTRMSSRALSLFLSEVFVWKLGCKFCVYLFTFGDFLLPKGESEEAATIQAENKEREKNGEQKCENCW